MHRTLPSWVLVVAVVSWTGAFVESLRAATAEASAAAEGQIVLHQTPLGPMSTDTQHISISPDGSRVALVANAGSRQQVFIDGNEGAQYSTIVQLARMGQTQPGLRMLMISPDLSRVAYVATKGPSDWVMVVNHKEGPVFEQIKFATFSPVGHRLAYIGTKGGKQYAVVDSTISAGYQMVAASELSFSADGKHVGYTASTGIGPNPWRVVIDGKEGPGFPNVQRLQFCKDGSRYAYIAQPENNAEKNNVVVDDKVGPQFAQIQSITLSNDGKHVAYVGLKPRDPKGTALNPKWVAVIDEQESTPFDQIPNVVISPDGNHTAFAGTDNSTGHVVSYAFIDSKKSLDYISCDTFLFSPDSQHVAYRATATSGKSVVVLDGRESDAHEQIYVTSMQFSPDSKRLAYIAIDQGRQYVVADGKVGPAYPAIDSRTLEFTSDSQHYHFRTRGATDAWAIATDDTPPGAPGAAAVVELVTTPDGKHFATHVTKGFETSQQTEHVLLDGKPVGEIYSRVSQLQISADGNHVAFIANYPVESEKKLTHAVIDGHDGPAFLRIDKLLLSPDGQHIAYAATDDGTKHYVVIDSLQGPVYEDVFLGVTQQFEAMQFRADGSLDFLAVLDKKLNRIVLSSEMIRLLPKPADSHAATSPGYSQIYAFGKVENDGAKPAVLAAAPDGTLFGATSAGGEFKKGVIFRLKPDGSDYKILRPIEGGQGDGSYPNSIWVGKDGAVYGSMQGECKGYGAVFRCAADGSDYNILHAFTGNRDGASPVILSVDPDGTLFGLCLNTSQRPIGIFRVNPDGNDFKMVYESQPPPGGNYVTGVGMYTDGGDGYFYGVSAQTIFKVKKDGSAYAVVREFQGPPRDINWADRAPILGSDGMLYGIASSGGKSEGGVIYKIGRDGSGYALIINPGDEALGPRALAEGPDGKLYVLAGKGLIRVNKDGSDFTVLQELHGGFFPWAALVRDGAFYGMTAEGAKGGFIFRYGIGAPGSGGGGSSSEAAATVVFQAVPPTPIDSNVEIPPKTGQ